MATVTTLAGGAGATRTAGRSVVVADVTIDFAAAATAKGSALAAADIIECINVPANTVVLTAGIEMITALGGESVDTRLLLGVTGGDVDAFVASWDATAVAAGGYAPAAATVPVVFASADTIDLEIDAATTAPTSGVVRVYAVMVPVDGIQAADEVDRDQLA
jgi:hypothetical protein